MRTSRASEREDHLRPSMPFAVQMTEFGLNRFFPNEVSGLKPSRPVADNR